MNTTLIDQLIFAAAHTDDPTRLQQIVDQLNRLSAWEEARPIVLRLQDIRLREQATA